MLLKDVLWFSGVVWGGNGQLERLVGWESWRKKKLKPNKPKQDSAGIRNPGSEVAFLLVEVKFKLV